MRLDYMTLAGILSLIAALMHLAIIVGGPDWYRFFGAGEGMAQMAEQGRLAPTLITLAIATVLATWALYAWSGAGLIPPLPLLKPALILITAVYLLRGAFGLVAPFVSDHPRIVENSTQFWVWSSLICLGFGAVYLKGLLQRWALL